MKQYWKLFAASAMLFAVSLFGECGQKCCNPCGLDSCDCSPCQTCTNSCSTCCCNPCCCEPCDFVPPCPPDQCAYNAPDIIDIKCGWDIFVTGSFVYFQAKEENLEYMEILKAVPNSDPQALVNNYSTMCFDYKPGFKVGVGTSFGCDNWSLYLEYLRYYADAGKGSLSANENINLFSYYLFPLFITAKPPFFVIDSATATSKWRLEMDALDLLVNREYYVGRCLVFNSYFGLRAAWIDQIYKSTLSSQTTTVSGEQPPIALYQNIDVKLSSSSWGVGPKVGLQGDWRFCGGFYFFGDTSFDLLYTSYSVKEDKKSIITNSSDPTTNIETKNGEKCSKFCFIRPHAQIGLGFGWGDYFCCNDYYFDLKIGYEFHQYWNQNVLPMIPNGSILDNQYSDPSRLGGDLNLHGLLITARLDF